MKGKVVETDLLCVGGGIAGLMAAIRARDLGATVVIAEKGATRYSGAGRTGNDHFWCYIPEVHGGDLEAFIKECMLTQLGVMTSSLGRTFVRTWLERSYEIVNLWDSWGIEMKPNGKWECSGHSFPGGIMTHLKYRGHNQKPVLTEQARKRGATIMDRVMVFDLLGTADGVTGALAIDTRNDAFIEFRVRSLFLGTGSLGRVYPGITPALMGNNTRPFTMTGDGRAMAYRIGAELLNLEMLARHAGIKNYGRAGQGTWAGVCRDPEGKPIGKYVDKPDLKHGDIIMEVDKQIFERYRQTGRGPVYMDCAGISADDLIYLIHGLEDEGNGGLLTHLREEGIDLTKNPVEFMTYELRSQGRLQMNEKAETSVPGLYTAGDEATFGISGGAIFGWIAAENAAKHLAKASIPATEQPGIEEKKELIDALQRRTQGADWRDANLALQQTMCDYAGLVRSESLLTAGLTHLRRLKEKAQRTLRAKDRWELTRCLEVLNLYDLGELIFLAALERRESRGLHNRSDYPYTDPLLNDKLLVVKQLEGKPVLEWRNTSGVTKRFNVRLQTRQTKRLINAEHRVEP